MKKKLSLFCLLCLLCMFFNGCNHLNSKNSSDPTPFDANTEPTNTIPTEADAIGGGLENRYIEYKYVYDIYSIPASFIEFIGCDIFDNWAQSAYSRDENTPVENFSLFGFIDEFNFSKEDFKTKYSLLEEPKFTDEEIDVIYSNDKALIADHFMNPNCIRVGDEIYTPKWLATHSLDQVKAAGITAEAIEASMAKWEGISENTEVYANTKALLDQYQAETESTD